MRTITCLLLLGACAPGTAKIADDRRNLVVGDADTDTDTDTDADADADADSDADADADTGTTDTGDTGTPPAAQVSQDVGDLLVEVASSTTVLLSVALNGGPPLAQSVPSVDGVASLRIPLTCAEIEAGEVEVEVGVGGGSTTDTVALVGVPTRWEPYPLDPLRTTWGYPEVDPVTDLALQCQDDAPNRTWWVTLAAPATLVVWAQDPNAEGFVLPRGGTLSEQVASFAGGPGTVGTAQLPAGEWEVHLGVPGPGTGELVWGLWTTP